jgi:hypothetical protein
MSGNLDDLSTENVQEEDHSSKEVKSKGNIFPYIAQMFEFLFIACVNCMECVLDDPCWNIFCIEIKICIIEW